MTATGGYSPWGSVANPPYSQGQPGRRCGRLVLERLVIRRGRSDDAAGAAAGVYGGELELRSCVVEGVDFVCMCSELDLSLYKHFFIVWSRAYKP